MRAGRKRGLMTAAVLAGIGVGLWPAGAHADVRLPQIIGSRMVLQRDTDLPVWGWADPGEQVTVSLAGQEARATADDTGRWQVKLSALPAGGPHVLTITGKNTLELTDILVGEVWLCSGQSNMEMGIRTVADGEQEIARADFPQIRLFMVEKKTAPEPREDLEGAWKVCTPENLGSGGVFNAGFSAVAYFFGRELHQNLNVPVGLIQSAWGGTRIEPWTPPAGFAMVESLRNILEEIRAAGPKHEQAVLKAVADIENWLPTARQAVASGRPVPPPPPWPKHPLEENTRPTSLYNAMIHPMVPFGLRGCIWYQGESNAADGMAYFDKMKALIGGWRHVWKQGDFPFYYVQIAPFDGQAGLFRMYKDDQLPRLWEAQTAAMSIPNTGMVVTNDIGDLNDIHPRNKLDVGRRLALWALARTYGRTDVVYSGPLYRSMKIEGNRIRITFDHVAGGLVSRDGKPLNWFTIAGQDRKFVEAQAQADGDSVLVWSDKVPAPVAVRFAWSMVAQPNLMNKAGLPASAFRTDDW